MSATHVLHRKTPQVKRLSESLGMLFEIVLENIITRHLLRRTSELIELFILSVFRALISVDHQEIKIVGESVE